MTFESGARAAQHIRPLRQALIVTSRTGWTQCEGERGVEIRAGDVIWCPHLHRSTGPATTAMTHFAIQEALDGNNVT